MELTLLPLLLIIGAVFGSFLGAYTYRVPRGIKISQGRSFCPNCKSKIVWHDNIPLLSYLVLKRKCRDCKKRISPRYFIVELFTGITTALLFGLIYSCRNPDTSIVGNSLVCNFYITYGPFTYVFFLIVLMCLIAILVIDIEFKIIPDELIFIPLFLMLILFFIFDYPDMYKYLLGGFGASTALLLLNILTNGRGMGFGDVKLAILCGLLLGYRVAVLWLFLSFLTGAIVGIVFIILGKSKLTSKIAFGPFLVISLAVCLLFGENLTNIIFPILN